jgi:hypothetical protein
MRLAIGDIHGRDFWKRLLDEDYREYYFTGDYFDSFDIPFAVQYGNFAEICAAAGKDSRIKLCIGNHDYHYMQGVRNQEYSGFQRNHKHEIMEILEENIGLLQVLFVTEDLFIISHAGLSRTFMKKMRRTGVDTPEGINGAFLEDRNILNFDGWNIYGDDPSQSPIWIRPHSLLADAVPGFSQIVGHTQFETILEAPLGSGRKAAFIDTGGDTAFYRF